MSLLSGVNVFVFINSIAPILGGFCFFLAVLFLLQTFQTGSRARRQMYSVERQSMRQNSHRYGILGVIFLVGAFACVGLYGVSALAISQQPTPTPSPTPEPSPTPSTTPSPSATPTVTLTPQAVMTEATATPTNPATTPSATPTLTPTPLPTLPPTAFVNSPNGLYLREAPGGVQQLELIAHQATVILLAGFVTVDELNWQEIQTTSGNTGWVAADFLIYPGTPTPIFEPE